MLKTLKVSASPSASLALGVKLYACPSLTLVAGVPEIAGAVFPGAGGGGGSSGGGGGGGGGGGW